jgi:hypothetical protein
MNIISWQKVTVPINLVSALLQAGTGIAMIYADNETLMTIHKFNGPFLAGLILLHLGLNWKWIYMMYFPKSPAPQKRPSAK